MSQARTARRRRKQMISNNAHLSGRGIPRQFGGVNVLRKFAKAVGKGSKK